MHEIRDRHSSLETEPFQFDWIIVLIDQKRLSLSPLLSFDLFLKFKNKFNPKNIFLIALNISNLNHHFDFSFKGEVYILFPKRPIPNLFLFIFVYSTNKHYNVFWWEPWSSGYGRKLIFRRSWVWIPAPYL